MTDFNEEMKENTQKGHRYWGAGEIDRERRESMS